ncbi:MAG: hypothetical protein AAGA97_07105 [Pseudomonadota bacterium]
MAHTDFVPPRGLVSRLFSASEAAKKRPGFLRQPRFNGFRISRNEIEDALGHRFYS